jgi:hypothetical protein
MRDGSDALSLTAWQFTVAAAVALPAAVTWLASGAEAGPFGHRTGTGWLRSWSGGRLRAELLLFNRAIRRPRRAGPRR